MLVGHSYADAVISHALDGFKNVIGLVHLAAFGLDVGESCLSTRHGYAPSLLATENAPTPYDAPGAPRGPAPPYTNPGRMHAHTEDIDASRTAFVAHPKCAAAFVERAATDFAERV